MSGPNHSGWQDSIEAAEGERRRMSEAMHDTFCQTLAGAALLLERMEAGAGIEGQALGRLKRIVELATDQARALMRQAQAMQHPEAELMTELAGVAATVPQCRFVCEAPVFLKDRGAALALCRIAQEAASNAAKHARASEIVVELRKAGSKVVLTIKDDGCGFVPRPRPRLSSGLGMMVARAEAAGIEFKVEARPEGGTLVRCGLRVD